YNVYVRYNAILERSNALDFDDLLYKTYQLFCEHPEVADYYANKFQYVHIDEFQDTNKVQFLIAERLSSKHGNIFVVGDDDQSIYGWRGAKIENILNFEDIYRGAKIYKLERNYRSTKKILSLANCIIKNNTGRREKELWTDNDEGVKIETFVGGDENSEASYIATSIKNLIAFSNYSYKDFAVFMRVNAISRAVEQEFTKYAIPYRIYGGFKFFERKEIKDVLSYLKVVNNTLDDESFLRCISTPKRGIGDKTIQELREYATMRSLSIYDAIDWVDGTAISSGAKTKLHNFKSLLESFRTYSLTSTVPELLDYIIDKTAFLEQFSENTEENESKVMNINELKNSCMEFSKINVGSTLADYLNSVTLSSDTDSINDGDAVTVATIHSAKGLEYPVVFIMGCENRILPIQRSFNDESEMEEERRLMYVAITRAMQRLYITRAMSRYMYGSREPMLPSKFLEEGRSILNPNSVNKPIVNNYSDYSERKRINYSDFSEEREISNPTGYSSNYAKSMLNDSKPKERVASSNCIFKANMKVRHTKFGEGTVIFVKGSGDTTVVDVAFKNVGIKSLAVKYAPLEIVK
ncbi:MAG: UvrD-helicase domain-containing protein, partial [Firmicutes bacterium]|nr:UvrD-helicase domain-containing protein [Candidatus Caballimonas caccae]